MKIVIPGGSGQVGTILARHFRAHGHAVTALGRPLDGWVRAVDGADVVINLAGRNVKCRYSAANRRAIKESRVETTKLVGRAITQAASPPALWMNASTATIYRHALDRAMDEATGELGGGEPGVPDTWRFSIDVARSWEQAFFDAPSPRTRKVALRSAMTMSPDPDGVFDTLLGLVRMGLGGAAGTGTQFVSWIHEIDFVRAIEFLIARPDLTGPVNLSSPNPLPNRDFMRALRQAYGVPFGLPANHWMLELGAFALRTETELILKSRRVVPGRLLEAGFVFQFPDWPAAAIDLARRARSKPPSVAMLF